MEKKMQTITNILRNTDACDVEISTEPKMNKRGNPFYGRVRKHTAYLSLDFGANYTEEVNKELLAEGKEANFQAKESPYERVNEYFVRKGNQLYLQIVLPKGYQSKSIYELDDRPATEQEIKEFTAFFTKSGKSTRQGVDKGREVDMRRVKIENIIAIGGATWAREVA
jgi:hypothetical protein